MNVCIITCELLIYDAQSLKDKRSVIKKVTAKLRQRFNVAVAETNFHDVWQRAEISFVTISSDKIIAEKEINKALQMIDSMTELERTITNYEWL